MISWYGSSIVLQYHVWQSEKPGSLSGYEASKLQMFCHNNPNEWVDVLLNYPFKNYKAKIDICNFMFLHGKYDLNKEYHQWIRPYFMKVYENTTDDFLKQHMLSILETK